MATIWTGKNEGLTAALRFRRIADGDFDKPYMFAKKNEVIIGTFGNDGHKNNQNFNLRVNGDNVQFNGGKGAFARWEVTPEADNKCRIMSKKTGKYLRIKQDGSVDAAGGQGAWTLFKVHKGPKGPIALTVRLESDKLPGTFLHVGPKPKPKEFSQHYMFLRKNTVVLKHVGGQNMRVDPNNLDGVNHAGGLGEYARWIAEPEANGSECRFKSEKTDKYLRIGPQGNLNASGGTGPFSLFKVHKTGGGKVKLEAKKMAGKYPNYNEKAGGMGVGGGGALCIFEIFRKN